MTTKSECFIFAPNAMVEVVDLLNVRSKMIEVAAFLCMDFTYEEHKDNEYVRGQAELIADYVGLVDMDNDPDAERHDITLELLNRAERLAHI